MRNRKKILLRSSDLFGLENESMFINIELKNTIKEIKPESYNNEFDLQKQFESERNASRNFTLYGDVDSVFQNGNGKLVKIFREVSPPIDNTENDTKIKSIDESAVVGPISITLVNGATIYLDQIGTSTDLSYATNNIFGVKKGVYKIELTNITYDVVYICINGNEDNLIKQRLVFYDSEGEFLPYGNDLEEVRDNGSTFTVFNDFPFFYNIHWLKVPLEITR